MKKFLSATIFLFIGCICTGSFATGIPYYVSIKSKATEANVRTGPSIRYPIKWVYKRPGWPMRVVAKFERWRKVEDLNGEVGWIHETLLSGSRKVVIKAQDTADIYKLPVNNSDIAFKSEGGVIASLVECKGQWCRIEANGLKGWISHRDLWGTDRHKVF